MAIIGGNSRDYGVLRSVWNATECGSWHVIGLIADQCGTFSERTVE